VNGNMAAPAKATPEAFRAHGLGDIPDTGILAAGVPAAFGALVTALRNWGTLPLVEVLAPAIDLARNGFPVSEGLRNQHKYGIAPMRERFAGEWPGSAKLYLPVPEVGALFRNPALARTFEYLAAEKDPLKAFYRGDVAAEIAKYSRSRDGLLAREEVSYTEFPRLYPERGMPKGLRSLQKLAKVA
ncbi:MAG: gamma-glutamyltransferase, partial [Burkholderiales bacterium]